MRLGVVLDPEDDWTSLRETAKRAEDLGFDLLWIEADDAITASALAGVTDTIRVALCLTAGVHPVTLAEEAAVADLVLGGRLVLVLAAGRGGAADLAETIDVVLRSQAARPFRHDGPRWTVPANHPTNEATESRVRVTPTPAQIELPVWVTGVGAVGVAAEYGLTYVGRRDETADGLVAAWSEIESAIGPAVSRLRRPAVRRLADDFEVGAAVAALRSEQLAWGLDGAILQVPATALDTIAHEVRPRLQLDSLPPGLDDFWNRLHHPTRS